MLSHAFKNYIIVTIALLGLTALTGCETLFGTKGVSHYPSRTATIEDRRDEEVFTTTYEVLFDAGHRDIEVDSIDTIAYVADIIKKSNPAWICVTGYSDTFGDARYNKKLSLKRAQTVVKKLKALGVDTKNVKVKGMGETDPAVPTQDGIKLLENRRVVVELRK